MISVCLYLSAFQISTVKGTLIFFSHTHARHSWRGDNSYNPNSMAVKKFHGPCDNWAYLRRICVATELILLFGLNRSESAQMAIIYRNASSLYIYIITVVLPFSVNYIYETIYSVYWSFLSFMQPARQIYCANDDLLIFSIALNTLSFDLHSSMS